MPGSFDFLHIKKHTVGSSNELSFDVLDAARTQLDDKEQKPSRVSRTPGPSKGSYHGVAGTSTLSAVPEVERRKKLRHSRMIRMRVLGAFVVIIAVGALVFAGYSFYQSRLDFADRFNALVASVTEVDKSLVEVDGAMQDPLSEDSDGIRAEILSGLDGITKKLDRIEEDIDKSIPYAMGDSDLVALTELNQAVEGRKNMVLAAKDALDVAEQHSNELGVATSTWNDVLDADQLAREASAMANNASTDESTEAARQKTQEAMNLFLDAKSALEGIHYRHEGVDLSPQIEYLDKRIEALGYAVNTADALIAGDREAARLGNDAYNEADQAAARMAAELPLLVNNQVNEAFEKKIEPLLTRYDSFRGDVAEADADVRAYLQR